MENANATPPSSSSFEQDFISRVKSDQPLSASSTPTQPKEKKKLDKRFIIIAILAVVVVALIVISLVAQSTDNNTTNGQISTDTSLAKSILGNWTCDNMMDLEFKQNDTFRQLWYGGGKSSSGDYSISSEGILSMKGTQNDGSEIIFDDRKIKIESSNILKILNGNNEVAIQCERIEQ